MISFGYLMGVSQDRLSLEERTYTSASGVDVKAELGRLKVPENRKNPNSEDISIKFIRLKSTAENPLAPLVYLEGGPGSACSWQASNKYSLERWLPFLEVCDVILLDQRGTGEGTPRVLWTYRGDLPENILVDVEVVEAHAKYMAKEALKSFNEKGVDLMGYTTVANATDIDAMRQALGLDKISLLGFSYGTHLGLAYIRYFGAQVENAILVGTEGPNHNYKLPMAMDTHLRRLSLMAKQDEKINQEVPDLLALYEQVIAQLKTEPAVLTIKSPLTQKPMEVKVGTFGLNMIMRIDIGDASDLPVFPRLLYSISQKDYSVLQWFVQKRISGFYGVHGMSATMDLASGATDYRRERIRYEARKSLFPYVTNLSLDISDGMGDGWPNPDLGDDYRSPVISDVRTLFMSGTLDFNTPPYQAEEVRWGFSNSSHIIVTHAGHEQVLPHPEAGKTILKFLQGENVNDIAFSYPGLSFIPVKGKVKGRSHPAVEND